MTRYLRSFLFLALAIPLAACNEEGGGGGADGGGIDCESEQDGTSCGTLSICSEGQCVGSVCGDGIVDTASGEQCDDQNMLSGDGCEPVQCTYSCEVDEDCDDGDPCNGAETCAASLHRCQAGTPPADGTVACDFEAMGDGLCRGGLCASTDCGNGELDPGEECDEESLGCEADCTWQCDEAADCDDDNACNGEESCNLGTHTCNAPGDTSCDDGDPCSVDFCDPDVGCEHTQDGGIDNDGWAPDECAPGSAFNGGDCDDDDPSVNPGEDELCDAISHDCDEQTDEDTEEKEWYPDVDGDGWPDEVPPGERLSNCMDPNDADPELTTEWMLPRQDNEGVIRFDCADSVPGAHPDATDWHSDFYCLDPSTGENHGRYCTDFQSIGGGGSCSSWGCCGLYGLLNDSCDDTEPTYDWNCENGEEHRYQGTGAVVCSGRCTGSSWRETSEPDCGETATLERCSGIIWEPVDPIDPVCCLQLDKASCSTPESETTQLCR